MLITKKEFTFIAALVVVIASVTLINLQSSYRKSRDNERKNALGDIESRIGQFQAKVGFFPPASADGKIVGCDGFLNVYQKWIFQECAWDKNELNSPFFNPLPHDPYIEQGRKFVYFSNGETFQIFVALEGSYEDEYDPKIAARNISCGDVVCNAGRTNARPETLYSPLPTPLP